MRCPAFYMGIPNNLLPLLSVRGLTKSYAPRSLLSRAPSEVAALRGVDLELSAGKTLAIRGASGSGKSTLARCIAGFEKPTSGEIWLCGEKLCRAEAAHRHVQMVFQDPGASLNPRFSVADALIEAGPKLSSVVPDALKQVGLPASCAARRTSQLSGGQKVRLALARALAALGPREESGILILDESFSSMDLCVRAQIVNLLIDLQEQRRLAYILITHDPVLALHLADQVIVMSDGRIAERAAHA